MKQLFEYIKENLKIAKFRESLLYFFWWKSNVFIFKNGMRLYYYGNGDSRFDIFIRPFTKIKDTDVIDEPFYGKLVDIIHKEYCRRLELERKKEHLSKKKILQKFLA